MMTYCNGETFSQREIETRLGQLISDGTAWCVADKDSESIKYGATSLIVVVIFKLASC